MKKRLLITRRLPDAVEARANADYDVVQNEDDHQMTTDEIVEKATDVDALLITITDKMREDVIMALPENIKTISTFSIGFDHIDLEAAKARGIKVGNAPHGVTVATAEIAMLLILGSARRAGEGEQMIRTKSWPGWAPLQLVGQRLDGKKLGIFGFGKIGRALAQRARGFDMEIHYHDIVRAKPEDEHGAIYHETLDSLLSISEFFSINAPSLPETRYFFNKEAIEKMPQGAVVVNSARGDLVKDDDLIAALKSGRLSYAGLDVFAGEPAINEAYYDLPNTFLLPHLGSAAIEARNQMGFEALDNVDAALDGKDMPFGLT
ncbi:MAG: D-glycerate dehydrogenase [Alphaproteobacteria bacterium]|nr:D-glycerate dehydrogenase [Alphaproteobacteria bacterium]